MVKRKIANPANTKSLYTMVPLRRSARLVCHLERLTDDLVLKILSCVADDAKSLVRCLCVSRRFNTLATQSERVRYGVNYRAGRGRREHFYPSVNLARILRLFPKMKHLSFQLRRRHAHPSRLRHNGVTRWKVVASSHGSLYVMITVSSLTPLHPWSSFLSSLSSRTLRVVEGPARDLDRKMDVMSSVVMLEVRDQLPGSLKSLTLRVAGEGRVVVGEEKVREMEDDVRVGKDRAGFFLMPCEAKCWSVDKMQLPLTLCVARSVTVVVVKRSCERIALEKDVLLMVGAFEDDDVDPHVGKVVSEIASEISKNYKKA